MKPKCFLCKTKTARAMKAQTVPDRKGVVFVYTHAYDKPAFCSKRCAMNYGLISIYNVIEGDDIENLEGWSWNEKDGEWQPNG